MLASVLFLLLAGNQIPTFGAQVQVVTVTVTATDALTGRPVNDLKPEDFILLEDSKAQPVVHFEQETVPASVLVLLDTSTSMRRLIPAVRDSAARLIASLRPIDEVHVATFDVRYTVLQDFTTDHRAAIGSLEGLREGEDTALTWALYIGERYLRRTHPEDLERRRVLILLSDGENTRDSLSYDTALDTLRRSSVVCYIVHLRHVLTDSRSAQLTERAKEFVQSVAYETGGAVADVPFPYQEYVLKGAFANIADDLGAQYHLAYERPSGDDQPGWRNIGVALKSRSGIKLRFRRSYYVPPK